MPLITILLSSKGLIYIFLQITANQLLPKIKRSDLINVNETCENASTTMTFGKGVYGKCFLKIYQWHFVVIKEFRYKVTASEVIKEANMLAILSHAGLPVVLGVDLTEKPLMMVTEKSCITTLSAIMS